MQVALHPERSIGSRDGTQSDSGDVTLEEVLHVLRGARWLALAFVVLVTVGAGVLATALPKSYKATTVLAASSTNDASGRLGSLGSIVSQFGGLASLAGVALGGDSKKWEYLAVLESSALTENYIRQNKLLPVIYYKDWDASASRWRVNDPKKVPTLWKASRRFEQLRSVTVDNRTGLVRLTITWRDPVEAATWANGLVAMTNEYLRAKAIEESEREIAYLNAQAAKTTVVEAQRAIDALLESELDKAMIARGSEEYAFRVLDPAEVPEKPSSLPRSVWVAIAFVASLLVVFLCAFLGASWRKA